MPVPRRRYRRRRRKRTYRRRKQSKAARRAAWLKKNSAVVVPNRQSLPNLLINHLIYRDYLTQSAANTATTTQIWNLTSIYDIDETGTGSQSPTRDLLFTIYNKALVRYADIYTRFYNLSSTRPMVVYYLLHTEPTFPNTQFASYDNLQHPGILCAKHLTPSGGSKSTFQQKLTINVPLWLRKLNRSKMYQGSENSHYNTSGASPTGFNLYLVQIAHCIDNSTTDTQEYQYGISLTQKTMWSDANETEFTAYD